jgi:aspartate oxidase
MGDGLAMAARAGRGPDDLEFVQLHPTALDVGADPKPLVTEALRGQGAVLVDERGCAFSSRRLGRRACAARCRCTNHVRPPPNPVTRSSSMPAPQSATVSVALPDSLRA